MAPFASAWLAAARDVGGRVEVGLADLEVDDVAALRLERARPHQDFERGLGAEPRHALRKPHRPSLRADYSMTSAEAALLCAHHPERIDAECAQRGQQPPGDRRQRGDDGGQGERRARRTG